jgi:hypothetical protein
MAIGLSYKKYQTDAGTIVQIRSSAQVLAFTGQAEPAGAIDDPNIYAFASNPGSRRKKQLNARGVVLTRETGVAPNLVVRRTFVPIFTKTAFDAIVVGAARPAYGGFDWVIGAKINEA